MRGTKTKANAKRVRVGWKITNACSKTCENTNNECVFAHSIIVYRVFEILYLKLFFGMFFFLECLGFEDFDLGFEDFDFGFGML